MAPMVNQRYRIKILYMYNPQLMWVRMQTDDEPFNVDDNIYQIGLYGMFQTGLNVENLRYYDIISSTDLIDSIRQIKDLFDKFQTIYFTPIWYNDIFHLFDDIKCIFGKFELLDENGAVFQLDKLICEQGLGYTTENFEEYINSCKSTKLSEYMLDVIKKHLNTNIQIGVKNFFDWGELNKHNINSKTNKKECAQSKINKEKQDKITEKALDINYENGMNKKSVKDVIDNNDQTCNIESNVSDPELTMSDTEVQDFEEINLFCRRPLNTDKLIIRSNKTKPIISLPQDKVIEPTSNDDLDISDTQFIMEYSERIQAPKLLAHFKNGSFDKRWNYIENCTFHKDIYNNLLSVVKNPKTIQTAIWPAAVENHSIFAVGPSLSGKTFGIIAALCDAVFKTMINSKYCMRAPLALVICPNIKAAIEVENICRHMLKDVYLPSSFKIAISRIDGDLMDYNNALKLLKYCDILISTLSVVKIVTRQRNPLKLSRLSYLVVEDVDVLEGFYKDDVYKCINICKLIAAAENNKVKLNIYATSKIWCETMEKLAFSAFNPMVCIAAFQEFFVYSKELIKFTFISKAEKLQHLMKRFTKMFTKKAVVVCADYNEVLKVSESLKKDFYVIIATEKDDYAKTISIYSKWKKISYNRVVLVTCDCQLDLLNITDAECLIHYSLPNLFSMFHKRFITLMDEIPNLWSGVKSNIETEIFIDETNHLQLPKLTKFFANRCGVEFDDETNQSIREVINSIELLNANKGVTICEELINLGKCNNINCTQRHMFFPKIDDVVDWLPKRGYVTFELLNIFNVTHYSVRLLKHIDSDGKITTFKHQGMDLLLKMAMYYSNKKNHKLFDNPKVGDTCTVLLKKHIFLRCKVIKIYKSQECDIYLMDEGRYWNINLKSLYHLPDDFKQINTNVINVRLSGIVPNDLQARWNRSSIENIRSYFLNIKENHFMRGKIVLAVKDTLWLQSMYCCCLLKCCNKVAVISDVKEHILSNKIGTSNDRQLSLIYELCEQSLFEVPKYDTKRENRKVIAKAVLPEPQWAHLEDNIFNEVVFSAGLSINVFYVRLMKWLTLLDSLSDDLMSYVLKYIDKVHYVEDVFGIGDYCIVKYSDSKYSRARIDEVHQDESTQVVLYKCFYVDYGDWSEVKFEDMYPITPNLITRMPFQAIECKLFGLKNDDDKSIDLLEDLSFDSSESDVLKQLFSFTLSKDEAIYTKGKVYSVVLYDSAQMLNRAIVTKKLATYINTKTDELKEVDDKFVTFLKNKQECEAAANEGDEDDKITPESSFENLTIEQLKKSLVSLDDDDDDADEGEWECTFDMDDFQRINAKNNINKHSEMKIVEVPKDFKNSDVHKIFRENCDHIDHSVQVPNYMFSDHKTPTIRWHESESIVYLKIDLVGVEDYVLDITKAAIHFKTLLRGERYEFKFEFAALVNVDKSSHSAKGLYVYVKLIKLCKLLWHVLVNAEYQPKWIKFDYDFFIDDDNDLECLHKEEQEKKKEIMERTLNEDSENDEECIDDVEYTDEDFAIFDN